MIRYQLVCDKGDRFEAWFRGSDDFDAQAASGCRLSRCGSTGDREGADGARPLAAGAAQTAESVSRHWPSRRRFGLRRVLMRHSAEALEGDARANQQAGTAENSEDVGQRFAEGGAEDPLSTRREPRGIYGEATGQEVKEMLEEGIEFHPLPIMPEERN